MKIPLNRRFLIKNKQLIKVMSKDSNQIQIFNNPNKIIITTRSKKENKREK